MSLTQIASVTIQVLAVVLLADFISGLLHWFEDAYGQKHWPITGRLFTQKNVLHHHQPRAFVRNNWWQSSWDLMCISLLVVLIAYLMHHLTWHIWLLAFLGTNANQIHKWAHRTPRENGRFITLLQRLRLLQSTEHHARHHTDPKNSHYCVITDFVNPIVDGIGLWSGLEWLICKTIGAKRREDTSVGGHLSAVGG